MSNSLPVPSGRVVVWLRGTNGWWWNWRRMFSSDSRTTRRVRRGFGYITRTRWAGIYLQGLFLNGERKSIEPLSRRVSVPGWRGDTEQALQQFVNQSVWNEQAVLQTYRRVRGEAFDDPEGIVVIDDTGFAKKGRHSSV